MTYMAIIKKANSSYLVKFPDIPNINTYGETIEEALHNAKEALNGCLESDFERGFTLPKPRKKKYQNGYIVEVEPHISLAYQLRKVRNGISQSEIAKKLGISYQAYQKLENPRKCNPTVKTLEKISEVFGKNLAISFKS
ncbi:MAG: type II toxin-antitoxin system HicB family antitoxin [Candidatus Omnitrophica bacterium]|nr:type II toxin-antitoxin system HicB family antitoxin [Candidatus Omnitrophota bacterium]